MTSSEHLQMLINRAYFEDDAVYRALMAQRDVDIQAQPDPIPTPLPIYYSGPEVDAIFSLSKRKWAAKEPTRPVWMSENALNARDAFLGAAPGSAEEEAFLSLFRKWMFAACGKSAGLPSDD